MAAGLGFKTFTTGEVLTAADTNGYLMQGVLVFASAAARDAAITSPQEGQCCYLKDTDAVLTYSGAAWVGFDDSNAIQNSIVDAKGDLVAASGADTPARLAVGNNGETLVADSSTSTGLRYTSNFAAGKNAVINGAFNIWQRGTSGFGAGGVPNADRFFFYGDGTGATRAISQQTFTPGTAPVSGYESQYYFRYNQSVAGTGGTLNRFYTKLEDVRTFAGQTVTLSFWAKADAARTLTAAVSQNFGSGGSGSVATSFSGSASATTSWTRFSFTLAIPSISGKTVGTSSYLEIDIDFPNNTTQTIDIWGVQVEGGSVATAFQTATGTIQGELAACQRYYWRNQSTAGFVTGDYYTTTRFFGVYKFPTTMRVNPTFAASGTTIATIYYNGSSRASTNIIVSDSSQDFGQVEFVTAAATAGNGGRVVCSTASSYLEWSAEL